MPAEVEYLDDVALCTDDAGSETYLKNSGDVVWTVWVTSDYPHEEYQDDYLDSAEKAFFFEEALASADAVLVPGGSLVVRVPPEFIVWDLDLAKSVAWQGFEVILKKLTDAGQGAVVKVANRQSPYAGALATCTFSVYNIAQSSDLENADLPEVVAAGLGHAKSTRECAAAAANVQVPEPATSRLVTLADDLNQAPQQPAVWRQVETNADDISDLIKVLGPAAKFIASRGRRAGP